MLSQSLRKSSKELYIKTTQIRLSYADQIIKNNFHSYFTEKKKKNLNTSLLGLTTSLVY